MGTSDITNNGGNIKGKGGNMKYTIKMSCGHEDVISLFGKESDRECKIKYFENYGMCRECYKTYMEEKADQQPFTFNISVLPYIDQDNGDILLKGWFDGNTKSHKDEIKSLGGYRWSERHSGDELFSLERPPLCWNKIFSLKNLLEEIEKAKSIGAECIDTEQGFFATVNYQIATEKHMEWEEIHAKIEKIPKPSIPDILYGRRWNQKIYGKQDNYSVYPDGEKVMLTNEQATEIKEYLQNKEEYKRKVEEIKNGI